MRMDDNRFLLLVTRKLAGEATVEELNELAEQIRTNPSLKEEFDLLQKYWQQENEQQTAGTEAALQKVLGMINPEAAIQPTASNRRIRPAIMVLRIAAAVAVLVTLTIFGLQYFNKSSTEIASTELVQKLNGKGVKSTIALADGSKVWLNADSKIQYPARFTGSTREVYLNGEAFFDIEKNPEKPFIIHLANGTIQVLGTSFNVKSYDGEGIVETSVATGKVAFIPKHKNNGKPDTVFLTPNNKVVYELNTEHVTTASTVSEDDRAWIEGKLIFRSMLFDEIAIALERNFGKKVVFNDSTLRTYRLTGSFENNTLPEILYYLSKTKNFQYTISDEEILISR